ncbi:hypothetical protein L1049_002030 [Liquidambar formosana]|uniref:DNA repair protein RAD4 n=1 Tax=Liquidambar formosana TaxID=63359 RepID=A0AAP0NE61_LIQFO
MNRTGYHPIPVSSSFAPRSAFRSLLLQLQNRSSGEDSLGPFSISVKCAERDGEEGNDNAIKAISELESGSCLESLNDGGTLTNISRENVGKLLNRAKSRSSSGMKKQDSYLRQCESIGMPESRTKNNDEQDVGTKVTLNTLGAEGCSGDAIGNTPSEEKVDGGNFPSSFPDRSEEMDGSYWEDGSIPILDSMNNHPDDLIKGVTIEFSGSPDSASQKSNRRASAEDKELAELVHKVHLLCLLARGRLIDSACNDPLIQASLLSLLPANLLNVSDVSKLTTNALVPLVSWFHDNFHIKSPSNEERSFHSALAFALEAHEGTPEEISALSVALFRALNLTTRFVSILDVASLKPDADKSESLSQDARRGGRGIFKSSTLMVTRSNQVPSSPVKSSSYNDKDSVCETSLRKLLDSLACEALNDFSEAHLTKKSEGLKRKGDLEFEMQLEMALSATAVGIHENNTGSEVKDLHTNSSKLSSPLGRMKRIKSEGSPTSSHGISTAVGSRKVGPPLYWAEVYCSGENLTGKWVHVDAVNAIIDGEQKVEAVSAACKTSLRYVVAFAGHGAKDVTRRYCMQWYKIAPQRINSIWWDAVLTPLKELESGATGGMVHLEKHHVNASKEHEKVEASRVSDCQTREFSPDHVTLPGSLGVEVPEDAETSVRESFVATRNSLEDMELETRALTEPLPTNQQAYKTHPLYAIERWLTRYQILHPKGPILGFCSGHPVYPRACIQTLKTKDRWLREGLQVKANELPAKVLKRSLKHSKINGPEADDYGEGHCEGTIANCERTIALYGKWQMEPLCLPCAVNGIVPKNERGQVEVWSEKCLPPGTVHLRLPGAGPVAKRLEIDFAPAMVGFDFRNGRSFPVFDGIVVCAEFKDAVLEAYAEEEDRREAEEKKRNEMQAIRNWYQLLSSIVTRQRLNNCYGDGFLSRTSRDTHKMNDEFHAHGGGIGGDGQSLESQQGYIQETKSDALPTVPTEDHEHVFLTEDQSFDEESSVRTKRCQCGFSVQVEEL